MQNKHYHKLLIFLSITVHKVFRLVFNVYGIILESDINND